MDSQAPRPPYVIFETRSVEDRTRTIEEGHTAFKDVIFAIVTAAGTKDRLEKDAEEWLLGVEEGVKQERIPEEWLYAFRRKYENYKESRETPEDGVSIRDWPALTPAQVNILLDINIRTIEDVAAMTEEAIQRFGMGGRAVKARAQAWLDTSKDTGKVSAELENLRVENDALKQRDAERETRLAALEQKLLALTDASNTQSVAEEEAITEEVDE